jgi:hypothetical protein
MNDAKMELLAEAFTALWQERGRACNAACDLAEARLRASAGRRSSPTAETTSGGWLGTAVRHQKNAPVRVIGPRFSCDPACSRSAGRSMLPSMFMVSEADAAAIRAAFDADGEFSAAIELRRRFPAVTDNAHAAECARAIATWKPIVLPRRMLRKKRRANEAAPQ